MKKSGLKTGMLVEYRTGEKRIVFRNTTFDEDYIADTKLTFHHSLNDYDEELLCKTSPSMDIMHIYTPKERGYIANMNIDNYKLLWTRHETKKLTVSEIEAILGYPVEIISDK